MGTSTKYEVGSPGPSLAHGGKAPCGLVTVIAQRGVEVHEFT